ncbi:hypothetical protein WISP_126609 [Willisornis vidua]|uniref:Secreted protein n=1 Tax=Willisornis vidua TaxID=1566151 RepID=A0ABQ9CW12_9PASS|nr:hypothetical protein WISP_126609 [Willisornis vidua]
MWWGFAWQPYAFAALRALRFRALRGPGAPRHVSAVLIVESSQLDSSSSKVNSIKSTLMGEAPTQATNRSAGIHQGLMLASSKKGKMLEQMGKPPKHYHRQGEVGHRFIA